MNRSICFYLFLAISWSNFCQNITKTDSLIYKYKANNELDSLAEHAYDTNVKYYLQKDYRKAIKYSHIEVSSRKQLTDTARYKRALFNQGFFLHKNKQYYKSITLYNVVIDSFKIDRRTYLSYSELARNYWEIGNYYQSETYYKKGISQPQLLSNKDLFNNYINLSILYDFIETKESLKKELLHLNKADSLSKLFNYTDDKYYSLNFTFGNYYKNDLTFSFNESKKYYSNALKKAKYNKDTIKQVRAYTSLGKLFNKVKNDSANYYLNKGLKLVHKDQSTHGIIQLALSEFYLDRSIINESLININNALNTVVKNSGESKLNTNEMLLSNQKPFLLLLTKQKAKIYLKSYETTNDKNQLILSYEDLIIADKLLDAIKQESLETQSKLFWQKQASEVYFNAVKVCNLLNKPEEAFYFMEKNKALLLLENISENQIKKQANIPIEVLEKELELKQKINRLENELNNNLSKKDSLENEYYNTKIELSEYIKSLKSSYPDYHNYKKPIEISKLIEVQKRLDNQTMVLEYILNDEGGFLMTITKNTAKLHKIDSEINSQIETYSSSITKPINTKLEATNYQIVAHQLYQSLFPFSNNVDSKNITKLIVIPDYTLQNVPFEALLTSNNSNSYLINDYEISYAYSLSFLEKNNQKESNKKSLKEFLGIAPYNFNYENLSSLNNSKKELEEANSNYTGLLLTGSLATKSNFTTKVNDYKIIHLATHANANDSIAPWIAFYDQKMYLNEVHTLKNNAELIVLSACKTSLGEINPGEGVFSLARGFFHAGSKSVVSSLWNVNDKSSQEILSDFYTNLKKGKTKSEALRDAKLNYLNTHQLSEQSPYYWSPIVLIGDVNALPSTSIYLYIILGLLIILSLLLYRKIKK